jgi:hypothetical protein
MAHCPIVRSAQDLFEDHAIPKQQKLSPPWSPDTALLCRLFLEAHASRHRDRPETLMIDPFLPSLLPRPLTSHFQASVVELAVAMVERELGERRGCRTWIWLFLRWGGTGLSSCAGAFGRAYSSIMFRDIFEDDAIAE